MDPFIKLTGVVAPLDRVNIDTDIIIPAVYLKSIESSGYEDVLFTPWRYNEDGSPNADFVLNQPDYRNANVLVAGHNFGCGSSREHAPWALRDYGIKCIIAPSFADIFYNNCFKNGLLPLRLSEEEVRLIMEKAKENPGVQLTVDLEGQGSGTKTRRFRSPSRSTRPAGITCSTGWMTSALPCSSKTKSPPMRPAAGFNGLKVRNGPKVPEPGQPAP